MERRSTHASIGYSRMLDGELLMDPRRRAISVAGLSGPSMGFALPALGSCDPAIAKLYGDELARIHKA